MDKLLADALSRYDIDTLVRVWYDAAFLGDQGKELRQMITEAIPDLAFNYGLPVPVSFRELVESYDEKMYSEECDAIPGVCLTHFVKAGDLRNVKLALKKGAELKLTHANEALKSRDRKMLKFIAKEKASLVNELVLANLHNFTAIQYMGGIGIDLSKVDLTQVVESGDIYLLAYLVSKDATMPEDALETAVRNNDKEMIDYLIDEQVPTNGEEITAAIDNGDVNLIKYLVRKEVPFRGDEIGTAVIYDRIDIVELLLQLGAKFDGSELILAHDTVDYSLVKPLVQMGAPITPQALGVYLHDTRKDLPTIKFLIAHGAIPTENDMFDIAFLDVTEDELIELLKQIVINGGKLTRPILLTQLMVNNKKAAAYVIEHSEQ